MSVTRSLIMYCPTEFDLQKFADFLSKFMPSGTILYLVGPLGAGKTTFARGFLQGLGYLGKVKSPTYTLVEPYLIADQTVFHFDLYRIQDAKELWSIGFLDYFSDDAICLIEWPEKGAPLLPSADLACYIAFSGEGREIKVEASSLRGEKIMEQLKSS
jgi:tRNA threonylcarbamoyladenosine biosynthesis protein TsaE